MHPFKCNVLPLQSITWWFQCDPRRQPQSFFQGLRGIVLLCCRPSSLLSILPAFILSCLIPSLPWILTFLNSKLCMFYQPRCICSASEGRQVLPQVLWQNSKWWNTLKSSTFPSCHSLSSAVHSDHVMSEFLGDSMWLETSIVLSLPVMVLRPQCKAI